MNHLAFPLSNEARWPAMRQRLLTSCAWLAAVLGTASANTWAARPMITDDARVVDAQGCQIESWFRREPGPPRAREILAVPACNPSGNLEMTLGGAVRSETGEPRAGTVQAQLKTILKPLDSNGWGAGLAIGVLSRNAADAPANLIDNAYFYLPISKSFLDDVVVLHINLGAQYDRNASESRRTWGLGTETALHPRLYLIAETFGEQGGKPYRHGGLRWWLIPSRVQIDLTVGSQSGNSQARWFTIGTRILFPRV